MQRFSEKAPVESLVLTFQFALGLGTAETLTGVPVATLASIYGSDSPPTALTLGVPQIDSTGTQVLLTAAGGIDQNDYAISVRCATTQSNELNCSGILPVRLYPSC